MKNIKIIALSLLLSATVSAVSAQSKTETIKVSGNCGMCAKNIETAAKKAGATAAKWDRKSKVLSVTYDESKSSNEAIQKKVAAAGYDTEKYVGDEKAYKALEECCQYDDKKKAADAK